MDKHHTLSITRSRYIGINRAVTTVDGENFENKHSQTNALYLLLGSEVHSNVNGNDYDIEYVLGLCYKKKNV